MLFATIVVYFKATSQLSCGWTEATGYQGTVVIRAARNFRASWYFNPLGEITMLGIFCYRSLCKLLRLFFLVDIAKYGCAYCVLLWRHKTSIENILLHVFPWRWTLCSLCRRSLHVSRGERLFFCNRLMYAVRLNKKKIVTFFQKTTITFQRLTFHFGSPLTPPSCTYWRYLKYCLRLHFPRSWCIIKHEFLAVTHAVSGRFLY